MGVSAGGCVVFADVHHARQKAAAAGFPVTAVYDTMRAAYEYVYYVTA